MNGFHNNDYTYYGRDKSHPNMGYNWYGTGNWFQPEKTESGKDYWPQSDVQLMLQSMDTVSYTHLSHSGKIPEDNYLTEDGTPYTIGQIRKLVDERKNSDDNRGRGDVNRVYPSREAYPVSYTHLDVYKRQE